MTLDLAAACRPFVTTLIHGNDLVPTMNEVTLEQLRQDVVASSWFDSFRQVRVYDYSGRCCVTMNEVTLEQLRQDRVLRRYV